MATQAEATPLPAASAAAAAIPQAKDFLFLTDIDNSVEFFGLDMYDAEIYKSNAFRISACKVLPCSNRNPHEWKGCPFAHPGEHVRRRSLDKHHYSSDMCPYARRGTACPRGDGCHYSHHTFEMWLHPDRYRTKMCLDGTGCTRKICFFAHTPEELRPPPPKQPNATAGRKPQQRPAVGCAGDTSAAAAASTQDLGTPGNACGGLSASPNGSVAGAVHGAASGPLLPSDQLLHLSAGGLPASNVMLPKSCPSAATRPGAVWQGEPSPVAPTPPGALAQPALHIVAPAVGAGDAASVSSAACSPVGCGGGAVLLSASRGASGSLPDDPPGLVQLAYAGARSPQGASRSWLPHASPSPATSASEAELQEAARSVEADYKSAISAMVAAIKADKTAAEAADLAATAAANHLAMLSLPLLGGGGTALAPPRSPQQLLQASAPLLTLPQPAAAGFHYEQQAAPPQLIRLISADQAGLLVLEGLPCAGDGGPSGLAASGPAAPMGVWLLQPGGGAADADASAGAGVFACGRRVHIVGGGSCTLQSPSDAILCQAAPAPRDAISFVGGSPAQQVAWRGYY